GAAWLSAFVPTLVISSDGITMTDRLQDLCDRFRMQTRQLLIRLGLCRAVSMGLVLVVALILADFFWHFGHLERFAALLVLIGVLAIVVLGDLVQPLRQNWSNKEILRYLDTTMPGSNDALINIDELAEPDKIAETSTPEGRAVVQEALAQLERGMAQLDWS